MEESVEAVVPEQEAETAGDTQEGGSVSILKNMMENAKESQPQSFQLKNGSVTCVLIWPLNSRLAFSAASRTRSIAALSRFKSIFSVRLNSSAR